ncbi:TetR/AcrR family transcriptional regulator [Actinomadura logoneensis]|uniref:TetR/AcrR family transcriptional regulator n=1 Tax=Actinomadura logoneensis TaxID=2293572 RepID=A0A372JK58_9ACTN|nr:TetR/AcrR family transcriptional regulator [Actinomadura logoneensis]RFU40385.1 TetR/AcrR family transcriptional regulator [Actinomadura logoneensis]
MRSTDEILGAAIRHLNAEPTASMAQLAEAAGVSRATLHRHFASREDLLRALGERATRRWEESQDAAGIDDAAASGDPDRLAAALRAMLTAFVVDADDFGFALTDHFVNRVPELVAWGARLEEREIAFYAACQSAGVLRADLPVRWVSNTVYGLMISVRESLRRGDVAHRDVADLAIDTFLAGAAPLPTENSRMRRTADRSHRAAAPRTPTDAGRTRQGFDL